MIESYKQSIDKNKIPPGLLDSTAEQMRQALENPAEEIVVRECQPSKRTPRKIWSRVVLAAAAVLVVVLVFPLSNQSLIRTPLDPAGHHNTVELKDGILYFGVMDEQKIEISHNFGLSSSTNKWTIEEYRDYLGLDVLPGDKIKDYTMIDQVIQIQTNMKGEVAGDKLIRDYTGENGGTLTLTLSKSQAKNATEEGLSMIEGVPVSVNIGPEENEYQGQFVFNDISHTIETNDITQEDFILLMYQLVKTAR